MGRLKIHENEAEKFRVFRANKKADAISMLDHYGVPASQFEQTMTGFAPVAGTTIEALPDGAYWHVSMSNVVVVKRDGRLVMRNSLDMVPIDFTRCTAYRGHVASLRRMPTYMQRFYLPGETA